MSVKCKNVEKFVYHYCCIVEKCLADAPLVVVKGSLCSSQEEAIHIILMNQIVYRVTLSNQLEKLLMGRS